MLRVVSCLTNQHDWLLVGLAAAICLLTSFAGINLFHRARATAGRTRVLWLVTTGAATGYGIWATHFIAMLAYASGLSTGYDPLLTAFSLLAAAVVTGAGFALATVRRAPWVGPASGAIVGAGIAVMHYSGMAALEVPGTIQWSSTLVVSSIALGVLFSVAALRFAVRSSDMRSTIVSTLLLTLAIVSLHFTAMGAVEIVPDPTIATTALTLSPAALSVAIAGAAAAVLGISLVAALAGNARQRLIEQSEVELARQEERFRTAVMHMSQGLCMFDRDQRVVVANRRYAEIYGLDEAMLAPGTSLRAILAARVAKRIYDDADAKDVVEAGVTGFRDEVNEVLHLADGRYISVLRKPLPDGGLVSTHEDITERHRAEARIVHMAHHDVLTDLPNRALLRERLEQAIASMRQGERPLAVLMLDLDHFKEVNDALGHPAGDALLKAVADRLRSCVRETDTIARLGGDEFAIVQRGTEPAAEADALAKRVQKAIAAPFDLDGHRVVIGTSTGIAIAPGDGVDPEELLKKADLALYRVKSEARSAYRFFEPDMDRRKQALCRLEKELREALVNNEFTLEYQPLVNVEHDQLSGFEALLRWKHPERGNIPPSDFIPLAEQTGVIVAIGEWVLRQACKEAATWPHHLKVAVNVSAAQFKSRDLLGLVVQTLADSGIAPQRLELEITEPAVLQEGALETLNRLHDLGVRIALDDFGAGHSSLSSLRKFAFDTIKIDRSFIHALSSAKVDALAVVRSIAHLGVSLGVCTTAEGVETQEQMDQVRAEGCTEMQGFLLSRPLPAREIARLLFPTQRHKPASAA